MVQLVDSNINGMLRHARNDLLAATTLLITFD